MKQVIVMRTDLNMRKGKMIVQGCHASEMVLYNYFGTLKIEQWIAQGKLNN